MKCNYSMDDIISYTEHNISDGEAEKIKEHLNSCKKCMDYYNVLVFSENLTKASVRGNGDVEKRVLETIDKSRYKKGKVLFRLGHYLNTIGPVLKASAALTVILALVLVALANRNNFFSVPGPNQTQAPVRTEIPSQMASPSQDYTSDIEKKVITLYFGNSYADAVVPEKREVEIKKGDSLEKIIVEELKKGPVSETLSPTIPKGTVLLSAHTENGICTLDLSREFVDNSPGGTAGEAMTLNSVVNSLTELPDVKKVQFLIEGRKRDVYTHAVFNEPFSRNEGIIKYPGNVNDNESAVRDKANEAIQAIKNRDMLKLSSLIHPDKGVRFSPYSHVDPDKDQVFTASQMENITNDNKKYFWGEYDGSGDPIELTFEDYFKKFVYDKNFASAPDIGYNEIIGKGNTAVNISEAYPEGIFVEYHFPGFDKEYNGMDWESLRLVFENKNGTWYIVGILHDQWTI